MFTDKNDFSAGQPVVGGNIKFIDKQYQFLADRT